MFRNLFFLARFMHLIKCKKRKIVFFFFTGARWGPFIDQVARFSPVYTVEDSIKSSFYSEQKQRTRTMAIGGTDSKAKE